MIVYDPFWETIQKKHISTYALIHSYNVSSSTISRLRNNQGINTNTINDLCKMLKCDVSDILKYIAED
ncbi:helix-turn-helix domain-containing protein [Sinanaerobacter chloroacetimidivorans]|uniref:Helix-turn-helix transcriptional regulator n=1 Tax=Sinanaerobacter chloroacetimidivorans TaxID=2818044 RepID=A0A8J7W2R1_9FIRM|nr:helix-turn-helix transcriptional regulator [Sinanaerobacter chloroacetimidivorans]MBR0598098.1 helix-turn-helix transcriptional regulator [Sinanaerobacter chloroacetimidivorans]